MIGNDEYFMWRPWLQRVASNLCKEHKQGARKFSFNLYSVEPPYGPDKVR